MTNSLVLFTLARRSNPTFHKIAYSVNNFLMSLEIYTKVNHLRLILQIDKCPDSLILPESELALMLASMDYIRVA